jgi:hypothetical protein
MIVEEREYRISTGLLGEFWALYRDVGLPIQMRHIGPPVGFFSVEVGEVTNFVHMWLYRDLTDRETRRAQLHHDKAWNEYIRLSHKYIQRMNTRILKVLEGNAELGALVAKSALV